MADTHFPPWWRQRLLAVIGAPQRAESLRFLAAWAQAEGGTAKYNPLNTTEVIAGATNYNTTGVKNYPRPTAGVCATALTLTNGKYGLIVGRLQAGTYTAEQIVEGCADQLRVWGTDPNVILRALGSIP